MGGQRRRRGDRLRNTRLPPRAGVGAVRRRSRTSAPRVFRRARHLGVAGDFAWRSGRRSAARRAVEGLRAHCTRQGSLTARRASPARLSQRAACAARFDRTGSHGAARRLLRRGAGFWFAVLRTALRARRPSKAGGRGGGRHDVLRGAACRGGARRGAGALACRSTRPRGGAVVSTAAARVSRSAWAGIGLLAGLWAVSFCTGAIWPSVLKACPLGRDILRPDSSVCELAIGRPWGSLTIGIAAGAISPLA